jgi:hypothetical protein
MKLNPRVAGVVPKADYKLELTFDNGEVRIFDVGPFLEKGVFRGLRDEAMFRSAHVWHGTVQWAGEQDICPDTLYEDSTPVAESEVAAVRESPAAYRGSHGRRRAR